MNNNLFDGKSKEQKEAERRIEFFNKIREICVKKVGTPDEKPESFAKILSKLERKFPEVKGACEVLYDFYTGEDVEEETLEDATKVIQYA